MQYNNSGINDWSPDGIIRISPTKNCLADYGCLFHEIFHSAFHKSPLWKSQEKGGAVWGEGFCDAFRFFNEEKFLPEKSAWRKEMEGKLMGDIYSKENDPIYKRPSLIIIESIQRNYTNFKKVWYEMNRKCDINKKKYTDDYFGYNLLNEQKK